MITVNLSPNKGNKPFIHKLPIDEGLGANMLAPPRAQASSKRRPGSGASLRSSKLHSFSSGSSSPSRSSQGRAGSANSQTSKSKRGTGSKIKKVDTYMRDFKQNPKFKGKLISSYRMPQFFQITED